MYVMVPVVSSNVHAVGYDPDHHDLYIEFNNGGRYVYHGVDKSVHESLMRSSSKGSFVANYLRGRYPYQKL